MKIILFLVLILFAYCEESEIRETNETNEEKEYQFFTRLITKDDVETMIKENKVFVLCIFAEFSEKSIKFSKGYDSVAQSIKDNNEYDFFRFEFTQEDMDLAKTLGFLGLPAVLTVRNGKVEDRFLGGTKIEDFEIWIKKKFLPPIVFIESNEELEEMKNIYETIAFAEISEDEQVVELLENIAESELKQQFLFAGKKGSAQNTLTIYRQSDKTETKYNGDFEENEITEWLNEYYLPFIQELTFSTLKHYYAKQAPVCYLLMDADEEKEDRPSVQLISELNNEFYGKVWFVWAYSNELPTLADRYLITEFPGMVLINNINKEHYTYKGKFTKNEIKNWLNDFFAGKVEKSIKKELIPESNDGLIKTVVYDNWDEIVNDPEKDVLIKIYADWCQHCKKLEPVYQELAEKFQDSQNLVFAQINGDKNEIKPDLKVSGYPTIMLFPAENKKEFILFEEEERSIETLSKFLTENCKTTETIIKDNSSEEGADEKMQEDQKKEEEEEPIKEL